MITTLDRTVGDPVPTTSAGGVAALTAEDAGPPDRSCVVGELVWTSDLCADRPCQCEWGFDGAASDGITMVAEIRRIPDLDRPAVRQVLVGVMGAHGYPPSAAIRRVDRLLDLAASSPEGTLLRLEHGRPVPFPPGSRMDGPHRVVSPAPRTAD